MWVSSYEKKFEGITAKQIWSVWSDVNNWPKWDTELDRTSMTDPFKVGGKFTLRPKGGPNVSIELTEVTPLQSFTDVTQFPLARMHDYHEIQSAADGVIIKSKITVTGPLAWLWRRMVVQGVASSVPTQMEALVLYAKKLKN